MGKTYTISRTEDVTEQVKAFEFEYSKKKGIELLSNVSEVAKPQNIWNVTTEDFLPISLVTYSPNYWDDKTVGNKHVFFILKECRNPESARGFFNEFLNSELNDHRKVLEALGEKLRAPQSEQQLSGLGFSTTKRDSFYVKVGGSFNRILKVNV